MPLPFDSPKNISKNDGADETAKNQPMDSVTAHKIQPKKPIEMAIIYNRIE